MGPAAFSRVGWIKTVYVAAANGRSGSRRAVNTGVNGADVGAFCLSRRHVSENRASPAGGDNDVPLGVSGPGRRHESQKPP